MEIKLPAEKKGYTITVEGDIPRVECPYCHQTITPKVKFIHPEEERFDVLCPECTSEFLMRTTHTRLIRSADDSFDPILSICQDNQWSVIPPTKEKLRVKIIPDLIREISANFEEIYNEAYAAQQIGYHQICGGGYRKALEILLKDYASFLHPDKRDEIHRMELGNCIKQYIDSEAIQVFANRASWLGNDQLHYTRTWTELDIFDLETLVEQSITAIELEEKRKRLLKDMPKPGKKQ